MITDPVMMADKLKKQRTITLRNFTRNETLITNLLKLNDASMPVVVCTLQYEKFRECWTKMEETQEHPCLTDPRKVRNLRGERPPKNHFAWSELEGDICVGIVRGRLGYEGSLCGEGVLQTGLRGGSFS